MWPVPLRHATSAGPAGGLGVEACVIFLRDGDVDPGYGGDAGAKRLRPLRVRRAGELHYYVGATDTLLRGDGTECDGAASGRCLGPNGRALVIPFFFLSLYS